MPDVVATALLALAVGVAVLRPAWALPLERVLLALLRHPRSFPAWTVACVLATLVAQTIAGLVAGHPGLPEPRIHDEHALLLQADTFLHGRLANPTPPFWRHLETFHVLMQPTYAAKYPPAQGAVLALGRLLGHPLVGVWLSGAAFVAATAWMLRAWLRPPWARLGTVFVAANVVVATLWSAGYRGPFAAAAAGALLLGASERLRSRPAPRHAAVLGLALVVLAASRPYEGLVLAAAVLLPLAARAVRHRPLARALLRQAAPSAIAVLAAGLGWLGYYNQRITGHTLRLPFQVYDQRYARVPLFLWQDVHSPTPANPRMDRFYREFEAEPWRQQHTVSGWARAAGHKTGSILHFYLRPALLLVLLALPWALRRGRPRRAAGILLALLASQLAILPSQPHYVAPGASLVAYLAVECWRHVRLWRPRLLGAHPRPVGAALAAALPFALVLAVPARTLALRPEAWDWSRQRARLQRELAEQPGRQLVIVRYDPRSSPHSEWVYNGADPAAAQVLWARSLSPELDCALLRALPRHRPWRLDVVEDITPARLEALDAAAACAGGRSLSPVRSAPDAPPPASAR